MLRSTLFFNVDMSVFLLLLVKLDDLLLIIVRIYTGTTLEAAATTMRYIDSMSTNLNLSHS